mmetsp:Transcript_5450/g.9853  ORF Transcript_5450/g.9853 Transcript_5450/m.9853 type:complete len:87 (+) Transcript_5450:182-442(+)
MPPYVTIPRGRTSVFEDRGGGGDQDRGPRREEGGGEVRRERYGGGEGGGMERGQGERFKSFVNTLKDDKLRAQCKRVIEKFKDWEL